jgi:hypothetical protein
MTRRFLILATLVLAVLGVSAPVFACGGLLSPNGSVNLLRTTTLAAYHGGVEHYVTSFRFVGGGGAKFGSIIPLPGVPSKVERGGDWTLQRLEREVAPPIREFGVAGIAALVPAPEARVLYQTRIDALDITVLEGGGDEVGRWATHHGFDLPPDAPEVLDFYATRSPIFLAASFNPAAAAKQGLSEGDGTPIHLTIATPNPWVPLRILGLGKKPAEIVQADVFLLTDGAPAMLPAPLGSDEPAVVQHALGMRLVRSESASTGLMNDLRVDKGMSWMPKSMWLSFIRLDARASDLTYDLALDTTGAGNPSPVAAGFAAAIRGLKGAVDSSKTSWAGVLAIALAAAGASALIARKVAADA